jgi:hypothetical protein
MSASSPVPDEGDEILRQMRAVRAELRDDVKELVVSARDMADWTSYVRAYPWLCTGAALAAGFIIVPQRSHIVRPDAEGLIELAKRHKLVVKMDGDEKKPRRGLFGELLTLAAGALLQGGLKILSQQLTRGLAGMGHAPSNGRHGVHHD